MSYARLRVMQAPTVAVVNLALLGCILSLVFLLFVTASISWSLAGHVCVLLALAVGLLLLFNWYALTIFTAVCLYS